MASTRLRNADGEHQENAYCRPEKRGPLSCDDCLGGLCHQEREAGQVRGSAKDLSRHGRGLVEDARLVDGWLLFLETNQEAGLTGVGIPETSQQMALGGGPDQLELVGKYAFLAIDR